MFVLVFERVDEVGGCGEREKERGGGEREIIMRRHDWGWPIPPPPPVPTPAEGGNEKRERHKRDISVSFPAPFVAHLREAMKWRLLLPHLCLAEWQECISPREPFSSLHRPAFLLLSSAVVVVVAFVQRHGHSTEEMRGLIFLSVTCQTPMRFAFRSI